MVSFGGKYIQCKINDKDIYLKISDLVNLKTAFEQEYGISVSGYLDNTLFFGRMYKDCETNNIILTDTQPVCPLLENCEVEIIKTITIDDISKMMKEIDVECTAVLASIDYSNYTNDTLKVMSVTSREVRRNTIYDISFEGIVYSLTYDEWGICSGCNHLNIVNIIKPKAETITINQVNTFGEF